MRCGSNSHNLPSHSRVIHGLSATRLCPVIARVGVGAAAVLSAYVHVLCTATFCLLPCGHLQCIFSLRCASPHPPTRQSSADSDDFTLRLSLCLSLRPAVLTTHGVCGTPGLRTDPHLVLSEGLEMSTWLDIRNKGSRLNWVSVAHCLAQLDSAFWVEPIFALAPPFHQQ